MLLKRPNVAVRNAVVQRASVLVVHDLQPTAGTRVAPRTSHHGGA